MLLVLSVFGACSIPADAAWSYLAPLSAYMPARNQWDANYGYCGETSFIQAGLLYGQYFSQYTVRQMLHGHQSDEKDQLLLGVSDKDAAGLLKMNYVSFTPDADVDAWIQWIKPYVTAGKPVTIGVLTNFHPDFFGTAEASLAPGQAEYDHIVNVIDIQGDTMDTYSITFYDHGLWKLLRPDSASGPDKDKDGVFTYKVKDIVKSRANANTATTAYSIIDSSQYKYAIALTGPSEISSQGCPVFIMTSPAEENPVMQEGSNTKPTASRMNFTVTAYGLKVNTAYVIYMYNNISQVPKASENPTQYAVQSWNVMTGPSANNATIQTAVQSDSVAVFRCYIDFTATSASTSVSPTTAAVPTTTAPKNTSASPAPTSLLLGSALSSMSASSFRLAVIAWGVVSVAFM